MHDVRNSRLRSLGLATVALIVILSAGLPAAAQNTGWSFGLGLSSGEAAEDNDDVDDIELESLTLFGRWQYDRNGWGAMAELRGGEDDERGIEFDYRQLNLYATYTWRQDRLVRPFIKFGLSNTDVDLVRGPSEDDTAPILGGGLEVGRGRWSFHWSIDGTDPDIALIDPGEDSGFGHSTVGATYRF